MPRKVVSIHQPNYLPWPGYFNKISRSDVFVILDTVEFQTGNATSLTNRARIKSPQGELLLTMPVRKGPSKIIKDIVVDNTQPWRKKHLASIHMHYKKAVGFNDAYPVIENILTQTIDSMSVLNTLLIKDICTFLGITTPIVVASELPVLTEDKNMRLIEICKHLDATVYLSGNGAKKYNDHDLYKQHGLDIEYNNYAAPPYPQMYGAFMPYLSMLDALLNMGKEAIEVIK